MDAFNPFTVQYVWVNSVFFVKIHNNLLLVCMALKPDNFLERICIKEQNGGKLVSIATVMRQT